MIILNDELVSEFKKIRLEELSFIGKNNYSLIKKYKNFVNKIEKQEQIDLNLNNLNSLD